jgi:hypothetical protein
MKAGQIYDPKELLKSVEGKMARLTPKVERYGSFFNAFFRSRCLASAVEHTQAKKPRMVKAQPRRK